MKIEDIRNDEAPDTTEAAEELAADDESYTDEERADLPPEQRAEVERIEKAVEEFLDRTKTYLQTPENHKAILGFLEAHDLRITPTSLLLAFEELSEAGELELNSEGQGADDEQPHAAARPATAQLARRHGVESEDSEDQSQEPAPPQKKPTAWRNGKEIEVGA